MTSVPPDCTQINFFTQRSHQSHQDTLIIFMHVMYITMKIPAAHCHLVSCSLHTHRHHPPSTSIDRGLHFRRFDLLVASKSTRGGRNKKTVSTLFMLLFCCVLLLSALDRIALCVLNYSINQIRALGVWRPRRHSGVSPLAIKGSG